ncbi:MAG: hypothetical protein ACRCYO_01605 [Bacteroidia bacterium]
MKPTVYLTFNDAPTGIYFGQVTDVCRFWREELHAEMRLIAFVSLRGFFETRKKIKQADASAFVLPMFPKTKHWKKNAFLLRFFLSRVNPETIVARGPFATGLALKFQKKYKVCFDGRGAYTAELNEYNVVPDETIKREISNIEKEAVLKSNFRLAVSTKLVDYWREKFQYTENKHVVIPCTINANAFNQLMPVEKRKVLRAAMGWNETDIVLVYSGSTAGWQNLEELDHWLYDVLQKNTHIKLLLLTKNIPETLKLKSLINQVQQRWLSPNEVGETLQICDYGWLVREATVTNQVASPVKFAEYLACGLPVLVSDQLGDYPDFVSKYKAGHVLKELVNTEVLIPLTNETRLRMYQLAQTHFTKPAFANEYRNIQSCTLH